MNPADISIHDVCAEAVPRDAQGRQLEWSPDGSMIAYFRPLDRGFGLRVELDVIHPDGTEPGVLLKQDQIDALFPAKSVGDEVFKVAPPRAKIGFVWAPDGSGLLLHGVNEIYWLDRQSHQTRSLVSGKEAIEDVQLSPDGRWAGFIRDHNLWVVNTADGTVHAVTRDGSALLRKGELDWLYPAEMGTKHGYRWSPDSSHLAYLEFDLKAVPDYTPPFGDQDHPAPTIDYPTPGSPNPIVRVFVAAVPGAPSGKAAPTLIETGADRTVYLPRIEWLPDGKHLAVERLNRAQNHLDLLVADIHGGASRVLLTESDASWVNLTDILYFLKGAPQFLWASERSGYRHLYLYSLEGKVITQLTDGPWEVSTLDAVEERNHQVFYTSTENSPLERQMYVIGLDGSRKRRISNESGTHQPSFAPGASFYVDSFSTALKPWARTVYRVNLEGGADAKPGRSLSTRTVAIDEPARDARKIALRPIDFLTVKTHDGIEMNALLIRPSNLSTDRKYPVVIYVDGGPGHQAVRDVWEGEVSMWRQMLVQQGFIVFSVDNRGTAGRGHAYEEYIHLRFGDPEITDQKDAIRFLGTLPYVDATRIGVWGLGFGGALAVHSMLHPPIVVKAAFAIAPVISWQHYDSAFAERYLGDPIKNQDGYLTSSPLHDWQQYKGPMLVGQGVDDLAVHPDQTMELQDELIDKRKYVEVSLFPGEAHTLDGAGACTVLYQRATSFFENSL